MLSQKKAVVPHLQPGQSHEIQSNQRLVEPLPGVEEVMDWVHTCFAGMLACPGWYEPEMTAKGLAEAGVLLVCMAVLWRLLFCCARHLARVHRSCC